MTTLDELTARRQAETDRVMLMMNRMRTKQREDIRGGDDVVAFVNEEACIGCDQCIIVCDDNAIELYDVPNRSPIIDVDINRKARVIRDNCTGCRLCVLACPTKAIVSIDR
jgi:NAD-dependent dihydropyrimidine dehydrogenase PreA subunit